MDRHTTRPRWRRISGGALLALAFAGGPVAPVADAGIVQIRTGDRYSPDADQVPKVSVMWDSGVSLRYERRDGDLIVTSARGEDELTPRAPCLAEGTAVRCPNVTDVHIFGGDGGEIHDVVGGFARVKTDTRRGHDTLRIRSRGLEELEANSWSATSTLDLSELQQPLPAAMEAGFPGFDNWRNRSGQPPR